MPSRPLRLGLFVALPLFLGMVGCCTGALTRMQSPLLYPVERSEIAHPLPHHVAKYPGNVTFRFAMAHDVIHERFPRHGPDYYRARNREVQQVVEKKRPTARGKEADDYFRLLDDWAVGLAFLGQFPQAVDLIQRKMREQEALGYKGSELYSSYANLGTFLILWQLGEGVSDVHKATQRIGESIRWVRKAIEVYPQSHFGRERWQVVLEEFLLAVLDRPELLLRYDMVGNRLDRRLDPATAVCFDEKKWLEGTALARPEVPGREKRSLAAEARQHLEDGKPVADPSPFRACIQRVGAEEGWAKEVKTSHDAPVPFDEPALGIVGMWRMGAGANPHFALALGEILLRVGQRYIAWTAYERAFRLAKNVWPDPKIQERFAAHCRARQELIQGTLPDEDWDARRRQFEDELAFGQKFQADYRDYESRRLSAGASLSDPHFYDGFQAADTIATPVGDEDRTFSRHELQRTIRGPEELAPWCLLFAGAFCLAAALLGRLAWVFAEGLVGGPS
jgi:hypothetical protein